MTSFKTPSKNEGLIFRVTGVTRLLVFLDVVVRVIEIRRKNKSEYDLPRRFELSNGLTPGVNQSECSI